MTYAPLPEVVDGCKMHRELTSQTGQTPSPALLNSLLSSRPGSETATTSEQKQGINFTQFLAMMGEHLLELDPEEDMVEAFACFDDGDKGYVDVKEMRKHLGELGDRMEDWEVRHIVPAPSIDSRQC